MADPQLDNDQKLLDFVIQNPDDPLSQRAVQKLGIGTDELKLWKYARENPDDKLSERAKTRVFDRIADANPAEQVQGVSGLTRFGLKNLIGESKELQAEYLQKKGYKTRIKNDQVQVKKPGETRYKVVDPEGFDLFDVTDLVAEGIDAVATGLGFAAGAGAAAVTGPGALAAGAAGSGIAGAAVEAGRQYLGKELGFRPEVDVGQIALSGGISAAAPVVTGLGGSAVKSGFKKVGGLLGEGVEKIGKIGGKVGISPKIRPEAEQIIEAGKGIPGFKTTPGTLVQPGPGNIVGSLESSQSQMIGKIGAAETIATAQANKEAVEKLATEILEGAAREGNVVIGDKVKASAKKELAAKLKPAEDIYKAIHSKLGAVKPDLTGVIKALDTAIKKNAGNQESVAALKGIKRTLVPKGAKPEGLPPGTILGEKGQVISSPSPKSGITDLNQLSDLRTNVGNAFFKKRVQGLGEIYDAITKARSDSLYAAAKEYGGETFKGVAEQLKQANKITRDAIVDVQTLLKKAKPKGVSPEKFLEESFEGVDGVGGMSSADVIKKLFRTHDVKNLRDLKNKMPDTFEELRKGAMAELRKKVITKEGLNETVNPSVFVRTLKKMPDETKEILLGKESKKAISDIETVLGATPPMEGPSGTPKGQEILKILTFLEQGRSIAQGTLLKFLGKQVERKVEAQIASKAAAGKSIGDLVKPKTQAESIKRKFIEAGARSAATAEGIRRGREK